MRKITGHYIFPINRPPIKNGILITKDDGLIIDVIDTKEKIEESANVEFYDGIIVPGFVNCHCHLELSAYKNKIPQKQGLIHFIRNLQQLRKSEDKKDIDTIESADAFMYSQGIVAVADISNSEKSFPIKQKSKIYYHTFLELFNTQKLSDDELFCTSLKTRDSLEKKFKLKITLTPHAPYSVSPKLIQLIAEQCKKESSPFSIHNQESKEENILFENHTGYLAELLKEFNTPQPVWPKQKKTSLSTYSAYLPKSNPVLLVHNTYTNKDDIETISNNFENIWWIMCPGANLYIENRIPTISLFQHYKQKIAIGTDSLASNNTLSVLEELKTIQSFYPSIPLNEMLQWATLNGAKALNLQTIFGSLEKGKRPGINLINKIDFTTLSLTKQSNIKRLL